MNILSQELRDRAEAVSNRLQAETQSKKDEEAKKRQEIEQAAVEDFRKALLKSISEQVMERLNIEIKTKAPFGNTGWKIEEGPHKGCWSQSMIFAQIKLPHDCSIEIHPWGTRWKLSVPQLSANNKQWVAPETYESLDFQKATLEEFILLALIDFEENEQKYLKVLEEDALKAVAQEEQNERQRQEKEAYRAKVEQTDAEIRELIEDAIAPYQPSWPEGTILQVFKWRYCTGAVGGDFDYEELYSLSPHMEHDNVLNKSFVLTLLGLKARGFLVHPVNLLADVTTSE